VQAYEYAKKLVRVLSMISAYFSFSEPCLEFFMIGNIGLKWELDLGIVVKLAYVEFPGNENRTGCLPGRRNRNDR
jgi:hypothetical protein